jgi:hypothetical protein
MEKQLLKDTLSLIIKQVWVNIYDKEQKPIKILQLSMWRNSINVDFISDDEIALISPIKRKIQSISIDYLKPHPKYPLVFNWM